jgi:hypothetical protein
MLSFVRTTFLEQQTIAEPAEREVMVTFDLALLMRKMGSKEAPNLHGTGAIEEPSRQVLLAALVLVCIRLN